MTDNESRNTNATRRPAKLTRMARQLLQELVVEPEAESAELASDEAAWNAGGRRAGVVLVTAAVSMIVLHYFAMHDQYPNVVMALEAIGAEGAARGVTEWMNDPVDLRINRLRWLAAGCFIAYIAIPVIVVKVVLRERLRDFGLRLRGAFDDWWLYLLLFAVMIPVVLVIAGSDHFQATYPFYRLQAGEPLWPRMVEWELLYVSQFIGLEFFFRGFMVQGTRDRFGHYSVYAMMVPYVMIHFGKPMPETIGAIIAGLVLGSLALRTRSIAGGIAIHAGVALLMDFAALHAAGHFG